MSTLSFAFYSTCNSAMVIFCPTISLSVLIQINWTYLMVSVIAAAGLEPTSSWTWAMSLNHLTSYNSFTNVIKMISSKGFFINPFNIETLFVNIVFLRYQLNLLDYWILMSGGYANGIGYNTSTLFNWLTHEQCRFPDLPYVVSGQSLTAAFGVPVFCGGSIPGYGMERTACYKFNATTRGWDQVWFDSFISYFQSGLYVWILEQ